MSVSFNTDSLLDDRERRDVRFGRSIVNLESINQLAKLLAREDLSIVHDPAAKTASFTPSTRVLTLPAWNNIPKIVYLLFAGHEIGHALFTPTDGFDHPLVRKELLNTPYIGILNIAEDVRIEKRVKRKYPGLRADFAAGYDRLFSAGFFGVAAADIPEQNLADRLNLRFKMGSAGADIIPFADGVETDFLNRGFNLESFEDAVVYANDLYDYLVDQEQQEKEQQQQSSQSDDDSNTSDGDESDDSVSSATDESGDESGESSEASSDSSDASSSDIDDASDDAAANADADADGDDESDADGETTASGDAGSSNDDDSPSFVTITDNASRDAMESLIDPYAKVSRNLNIPFERVDWKSVIDDTLVILDQFDKHIAAKLSTSAPKFFADLREQTSRFLSASKPIVSQLAKEFEMRKAADQHRRSSVARTGSINVGKLHAYQYEEDIFLRKTMMPDGKNHGMVMYLDLSGSMVRNMSGTIDQLINLVMFCKRVQIPFEVYGFNDESRAANSSVKHSYAVNDVVVDPGAYLRKFISSELKPKDFKRALEYLFFMREYWRVYTSRGTDSTDWMSKYPHLRPIKSDYLSSTPLDDALIYAYGILDDFKRRTRVQICNFIILSDGGSNAIRHWNSPDRGSREHVGYNGHNTEDHYFYDEHTRTRFKSTGRWDCATGFLLDCIKARLGGIRTIGFYLIPFSGVKARRVVADAYADNRASEKLTDAQYETFKKDGVIVSYNAGYDARFLIKAGKSLDFDDDDILAGVADNASLSKIRTAFKTGSKKKVSSRVFINKFAETIS